MMKKKMNFLIVCGLILLWPSLAWSAAENNPAISVNGARIKSETPAYIVDGRTMIPLRLVANALNLTVDWDGATQTIVLKNEAQQEVKLTIGQPEAYKNGTPFTLDSPAVIKDSKTFVPLRFIAAGFGYTVEYDTEYNTVVINGNFQKPLIEADGTVFDWQVKTHPSTGKFQSIAIAGDNPAFHNGVTLNLFPPYFKEQPKREYVRLKFDSTSRFAIYDGETEYNLSGQLVEDVFSRNEAKSFFEAAFFDMTGDGNNEILLYTGGPDGFMLKVFLFNAFDVHQATTYALPMNNTDSVAVGDNGVAYMEDGSLRLYFGNGGSYQELKWNEATCLLELSPVRY